MAVKRMMNTNIINTDEFLSMPMSARLLYYDFCMRGDDDGFIDSPQKIMKMNGCSQDDLKVLVTKKYVIPCENGIFVITHWFIHNTIRRDRYNPTMHIEARNNLKLVDKIYQKDDEKANWQPVGNHLATNWQPRKEKNSSNNYNIEHFQEKSVFDYLEEEFGKLLSPMEIEVVKTWNYDIEIIKLAIKEASTNNQRSIKYIDKILYNWEQANLKSSEEVKNYCENFRNRRKKSQLQTKNKSISSTDLYPEL